MTEQDQNAAAPKGTPKRRGVPQKAEEGQDFVDVVAEAPPVKKGRRSWKPAERLTVEKKNKNFRYRWCDRDLASLQKKQAEGWVFVNKTNGIEGDHIRPDGVADGSQLGNLKAYRDVVLMALPEEIGLERDAYFEEKTQQQTTGLKDVLDADLDEQARSERAPKTRTHGSIVID